MRNDDFKKRTKNLGLRVINLAGQIPRTPAGRIIGNQLMRSATSVGANYRAACRAKSRKDQIIKLKIVEEEADETLFWLEMLSESGIVTSKRLQFLMKETDEIIAITVTSIKTLRTKS